MPRFRKINAMAALFLLGFLAVACGGSDPQPARSTRNLSRLNDSLVNYNQGVVREEDRQIDDFLTRHRWTVTVSPTGLRSLIYRKGNGKKVVPESIAVISGTVCLLNGDTCYVFTPETPKTIALGHSEEERGLEEGILMLREGDRAKFIVPSHLAFGLLGDQGRIPARAVLVYDIELLNINEYHKNH